MVDICSAARRGDVLATSVLQAAMDSCNIPFATQNRFLARLAPMQHQVVTR